MDFDPVGEALQNEQSKLENPLTLTKEKDLIIENI